MKTTIEGPTLRIVMDTEQIFPNDPGNGQPVYVETKNGKFSGSWNAATGTGELSCGDYLLTKEQLRWLDEKMDEVEQWMRANKV